LDWFSTRFQNHQPSFSRGYPVGPLHAFAHIRDQRQHIGPPRLAPHLRRNSRGARSTRAHRHAKKNLSVQVRRSCAPADPPGGFLKNAGRRSSCPSGWLERRLFRCRYECLGEFQGTVLEGSSSFTASIISSGAKEVCRYSNEICSPRRISILRSAAPVDFHFPATYEPIWMPYAPAFIRSAPPTVPGTPISPSMPPKLFFAQNVTVRPRSAAASTVATFSVQRDFRLAFHQLQHKRTAIRRRLPANSSRRPEILCGTPRADRAIFSKPGMASCRRMRNRSVVPPIPREVSSAKRNIAPEFRAQLGKRCQDFGFP